MSYQAEEHKTDRWIFHLFCIIIEGVGFVENNEIKIVIAAIQFSLDDKLITMTGTRHVDIREEMYRRNFIVDPGSTIEGFLTNEHLFVNRVEAYKIAVAANQLNEEGIKFHEDYPSINELFSEDVW